MTIIRSPEENPTDAARLTGRDVEIDHRLALEADATVQDLDDFGESPGGQTSLRYVAAYADVWGDDPRQDMHYWMLQGFPLWFAALDDELYADQLSWQLADHHASTPAPETLPTDWTAASDLGGLDLDSLSLATFIGQTHGEESLIELVDRGARLDPRRD